MPGSQLKCERLNYRSLLIEVDNDLHFTDRFLLSKSKREPKSVRNILVTLLAHGCFIGPYTMSRLTDGVSYEEIRHITDWQLTEEAQRSVLAIIVDAITKLDVTKHWGSGQTSSSDGQRYEYKRKSLRQTFSTKFGDYALEFYTFVADNYAPYYSTPIECTERDAPYALDGFYIMKVIYHSMSIILTHMVIWRLILLRLLYWGEHTAHEFAT